jgi:hypothetical protein
MKRFFGLIIAVLLVLLFGCTEVTEDNKESKDIFEENSDGLLLVTNKGNEDLVLFYDSVCSENLIGGIKAGAVNHRVKLPIIYLAYVEAYIIYAVKYSEYETADKSALSNLKVVGSKLISYYNEEISCEFNTEHTGDCEVVFSNDTEYCIEIGNGGTNRQDVLCVIPPYSKESIFVKEDEYTFYIILNNIVAPGSYGVQCIQRFFSNEWAEKICPATSTEKIYFSVTSESIKDRTNMKEETIW